MLLKIRSGIDCTGVADIISVVPHLAELPYTEIPRDMTLLENLYFKPFLKEVFYVKQGVVPNYTLLVI